MPREVKLPYYSLLPTPDVGERVVQFFVPQQFFKADTVVTAGVTLTDFLSSLAPMDKTNVLDKGYGSYTLTQPVLNDTGANDGTLSFYFAKPKTSGDLSTLTPFKTETIWDFYTWPAVLQVLYGIEGTASKEYWKNIYQYESAANSGINTDVGEPIAEDRIKYIEEQKVFTEIVVRDYVSNVPFSNITIESPVTTVVEYSFRGMKKALNCLHPTVYVPELFKTGKKIPDFGTENAMEITGLQMQVFPATEMTEWQDHFFKADFSDQNGIYFLRTYEALAPAVPDSTVQ